MINGSTNALDTTLSVPFLYSNTINIDNPITSKGFEAKKAKKPIIVIKTI